MKVHSVTVFGRVKHQPVSMTEYVRRFQKNVVPVLRARSRVKP